MKQNASFSIYHLINAHHPMNMRSETHCIGFVSFDVWKEAFHHSDKTC